MIIIRNANMHQCIRSVRSTIHASLRNKRLGELRNDIDGTRHLEYQSSSDGQEGGSATNKLASRIV